MAYYGHPDFDAPEFHRDGPDGSAPKSRRLTREELRRLQEQLDEIDAHRRRVLPEVSGRQIYLFARLGL